MELSDTGFLEYKIDKTLRSGSSLRFDRRNRLLARKEPPIEVALCFFRVPVGRSPNAISKTDPAMPVVFGREIHRLALFAPTEVAWLHGLHVGVAGVAVSVQATPSTRSSDPEGRWRGSLFTRKTNRVPTTSKEVIPADFLSMQRLPELRQGSVRKPSRWPDAGAQLLRSPRPGLTAGRMVPRQIPHSTTGSLAPHGGRPSPTCPPARQSEPRDLPAPASRSGHQEVPPLSASQRHLNHHRELPRSRHTSSRQFLRRAFPTAVHGNQ